MAKNRYLSVISTYRRARLVIFYQKYLYVFIINIFINLLLRYSLISQFMFTIGHLQFLIHSVSSYSSLATLNS